MEPSDQPYTPPSISGGYREFSRKRHDIKFEDFESNLDPRLDGRVTQPEHTQNVLPWYQQETQATAGEESKSYTHNTFPFETPHQLEPREEQSTYVNAKQFRRILKRRVFRQQWKKMFGRSSLMESRTYLHESRHKHATRRPRGPGGRFLNAEEIKKLEAEKELPAKGRWKDGAGESQVAINTK
ncbi:CCAAT-binding transcription factor (CBF-B/NF-YA) subunit B-domain-containing protein [Echria macrotheca]|uniref:Transcriptional activator HAP2 n=1 Tax=Echria macrotheca TaxID=438768 RepID=A0AAJ0BE09_9PEZI|nr:CCAAT-binding transcription factor (CBF-B/NF-YA) subunit B-domain-containing protein [Echria macrotheca]